MWRGLGINYAGGVLDHPARVAIHFTHRVGAVVAGTLLLLAAFFAFRGLGAGPRWAALAVLAALGAQVFIGVFMVLRAFPLELAAAHNAGAALLVAATVLLNRKLRPMPIFTGRFSPGPISAGDRLNSRAPTTAEPLWPPPNPSFLQPLRAGAASTS